MRSSPTASTPAASRSISSSRRSRRSRSTALSFFGDLVEGSADSDAGAVYVGLTSLALVLLLIGAAVRANTLDHSAIPALGVSTLVGALALLGLQLAVWTSLRLSRDRVVNVQHSTAPDL